MVKMRWFIFLLFFVTTSIFAQTPTTVVDYLSVPGPLAIGQQSFELRWSSNPNEFYYKQEYHIANQPLKKYSRMIMLDLLIADIDASDAMAMRINELEQRKESDPIVKYQSYHKDNETLLDFLISIPTEDKLNFLLIERNVYRYVPVNVEGKNAILLIGISERGYAENMQQFVEYLKNDMGSMLNAIGEFSVPTIRLQPSVKP